MIRPAIPEDTKTIARLIKGLAEYEKLSHEVHLDESRPQEHLFGPRPFAEVLLAEEKREVVGLPCSSTTIQHSKADPAST